MYFLSIFRSIEEARQASENLASGGSGYIFSGSLDSEFVLLNQSMIASAQEVNRYRAQLEGYAGVMARMDDQHPIRLGLYFPLLRGWREWSPACAPS